MRARNIKPGFCGDKKLVKCSSESHLLFPMLWMMADREGRLEDDSEQIELDSFFRVRGFNCEKCLIDLCKQKLITRYEAEGNKYIQINNFKQHQNPHKNETESVIPKQTDPLPDESSNGSSGRADPLSLIPDSLIPNTDTPLTPQGGNCPYDEIINLYHKILPTLPKVKSATKTLKARIKSRWKESRQQQEIWWWADYFVIIGQCDFLMGRVKDWNADFHWITGPKNMTKVINGAYDNKGPRTGSKQGDDNARVCEEFVNECKGR